MIPGQMTQLIGTGGFNVTPTDASQTPWLENMVSDPDGTWRPRYGLKWLKDYPGVYITMLSSWYHQSSSLQYLSFSTVSNSEHYLRHVNPSPLINFSNPSAFINRDVSATVDPGSISPDLRSTSVAIGVPASSSANVKMFYSHVNSNSFQSSEAIQSYTDVANQEFMTDPSAKNISGLVYVQGFLWSHSYHVLCLDGDIVRWCDYSDINSWPLANYKRLHGNYGRGIAAAALSGNTSFIFCENGVLQLFGDIAARFRWAPSDIPTCVSPHGCVVSTGDKIFYMSPGPKLCVIGSDKSPRFDYAIAKDLREVDNVADLSAFYDPLHDAYCLSGRFAGGQARTYLFDATEESWKGVFTYGDTGESFALHKAVNVGPRQDPAKDYYNTTTPFASVILAAISDEGNSRLLTWDSTLFVDETSGSTSEGFTCAIESSPAVGDDVFYDKVICDVYGEVHGTWEVKLYSRSDPYSSWNVASLGSISEFSPWIHVDPYSADVYKERKIRLEASSTEGLRVRRVSIRERNLGATR